MISVQIRPLTLALALALASALSPAPGASAEGGRQDHRQPGHEAGHRAGRRGPGAQRFRLSTSWQDNLQALTPLALILNAINR